MTKRRVHAEPRAYWHPAEHAMFVATYPHVQTKLLAAMLNRPVRAVYARAKTYGLAKTPEYLASPLSGRTNGRQGVGTRFVKGQTSWNKGKRWGRGWAPGRMAETQFKKGNKSHTWKPVGSFRVNSEGFLDIKVDDTAKGPRAWVAVHRLNWIAAHGPIPKGMVVRFKDGNRRNPLAENLELVTRAENLNRNWHDRVPHEIKQITQLRGAITRQINKRTRHERSTDQ